MGCRARAGAWGPYSGASWDTDVFNCGCLVSQWLNIWTLWLHPQQGPGDWSISTHAPIPVGHIWVPSLIEQRPLSRQGGWERRSWKLRVQSRRVLIFSGLLTSLSRAPPLQGEPHFCWASVAG